MSDKSYRNDKCDSTPVTSAADHDHLNKIREEVIRPQGAPRFHGLDIGILQLGVQSNGSVRLHLNLGVVEAGANVGLQNGADAGVHLGPILDGRAGAFVGADNNGFHGNVGARAHAIGLVGAGGEVNARLGDATGADVAAGANVGKIGARAGVGAGLGDDGLDAAVTARARAGRLAGLHTGAHLGLNDNSELAAGLGGNIGDLHSDLNTGIYSDRNTTFRPDISLSGGVGRYHDHDGILDLNPPIGYPGEDHGPYCKEKGFVIQKEQKDTPVESQPLPPAHEAATPENVARVSREVLAKLCHDHKYTAQKGDTYESIAAKLMPDADKEKVTKFAEKLQKMNESNGYKGLHPGLVLNTEDPYTIEREAKKLVAEHFGQVYKDN